LTSVWIQRAEGERATESERERQSTDPAVITKRQQKKTQKKVKEKLEYLEVEFGREFS